MMGAPIFATIATTDFLPRVHALHASVQEVYGDEIAFAALCIDDPDQGPPALAAGLDAVTLAELDIPTIWDMAFRYEKGAFANALKPFFLRHLLMERRPPWLVFLDADTLVYSRFEEVHALLDDGAAIVLTPHIERPQPRIREPFEIDLLRHGVTNGGFVALAPDRPAQEFCDWWAEHLKTDCRYEPELGYYGDQHWLDLAPALFDGVRLLRHRGYNAAYWNYPDRAPREVDGRWTIGPDPLRFYHFSQWRLERGETVEECLGRLFSSGDPELRRLLSDYHDRWRAAAPRPPHLDAPDDLFASFRDGSPIPKAVRDAYARLNPPQASTRERLFGEGLALVMQRCAVVPAFRGLKMTELYVHLWRLRPDLRHFDVFTRDGQIAFMRWLLAHAPADYGLTDQMLGPARESLARDAESSPQALLRRVADAHRRVRSGAATIDEVAARSAALLGLLAETVGVQRDGVVTVGRRPDFFSAVAAIRTQARDRLEAADLGQALGEVEGHGRYMSKKLDAVRRGPPSDGGKLELRMIEADAILNGCTVLAELVERLSAVPDRLSDPERPVSG